jgi:hypothetical protein
MSAAAAAFAAESVVTRAPVLPREPADTTQAVARLPVRWRPPRAVMLAGAALLGSGIVLAGTALLGGGAGDGQRSGAVADSGAAGSLVPAPSSLPATGDVPASPEESPPGGPGSATPSPAGTSAPAQPPAAEPGTDSGAGPPVQITPSVTATGSDSGSGGSTTTCEAASGSGALTGYSACASSGTVTFQVTFNTSQRFYHAFINTDGDSTTGYQLPYPSSSVLGADYMIENNRLYRSTSGDWGWKEVASSLRTSVSGSTYTWTLPLSAVGSPSGTQRVAFHAGSDYTSVVTFTP